MKPNIPYLPGKFCQDDLAKPFMIGDKEYRIAGEELWQGGIIIARVLQIDRYGFRYQAQVVNNSATGYVAYRECSKLDS